MITAPLGRPRKVPKSGAAIRKPRRPNGLVSLCINRGRYQSILPVSAATPQFRALSAQKKDSGSARQGETANTKTCNRPNRLNLLNWTAPGGCRSNYLRFFLTEQVQLRQALTTSSPFESSPRRPPPRPSPLAKSISTLTSQPA